MWPPKDYMYVCLLHEMFYLCILLVVDSLVDSRIKNSAPWNSPHHLFCVCVCVFLGLHPWYTDVPRLGVKLELQLPAYATATATWDLSHVCDLHHSSWPPQILNPLSEARDGTRILMDASRVHCH